jgi:hypothetical protein
MNRRNRYLGIFIVISFLLGYPMGVLVVEGDLEGTTLMFGTWVVSSVVLYAVYIGRIRVGADVALRERYSAHAGHIPFTRDEEIMNQYAFFLQGYESIIRDEHLKESN